MRPISLDPLHGPVTGGSGQLSTERPAPAAQQPIDSYERPASRDASPARVAAPAAIPEAVLTAPSDRFSAAAYHATVTALAAAGGEQLLDLLRTHYEKLGLPVKEERVVRGGRVERRLIASVPGKEDETVVLTGRHDLAREKVAAPLAGRSDTLAESAHAVAALLEGARRFAADAKAGRLPERGLELVHVIAGEKTRERDTPAPVGSAPYAALTLEPDREPSIRAPHLRVGGTHGRRATVDRVALELGVALSRRTAGGDPVLTLGRQPDIADFALGEVVGGAAMARVAIEAAARFAGLPETTGLQSLGFYRTFYGSPPKSAEERALFEYLHGAPLVYTDDANGNEIALRRMRGTVLHDAPADDTRLVLGDANPAAEMLAVHQRLGDKWEEHRLLDKYAPEMSPVTLRGDELVRELGMDPKRDPRGFLVAVQELLKARYGKYILKPRWGFGSDGRLPTHKHDFGALWDNFQKSFVPEREELKKTIDDPIELNEHLYESVPFAEGQALEELVKDPSTVVIQPFVQSRDEMRVHVVGGRVISGATVGRWSNFGKSSKKDDIQGLEAAVQKMLDKMDVPISATMDALVTDAGFSIIDLNSGIESGMYFPENDVYVANLLAERFRGEETPYLRDFRAFARAPLADKLALVRGIDARIGAFVRKKEASGFYDQVLSVYIDAVAKDPRPETLLEAWRQLIAIRHVDVWELYRLLFDAKVRPAIDGLSADQRRAIVRDLNAADEDAVTALDESPGAFPFVRAPETEYDLDEAAAWLVAHLPTGAAAEERSAALEALIAKHIVTDSQFTADRGARQSLFADALDGYDAAGGQRLFVKASHAELLEACRRAA